MGHAGKSENDSMNRVLTYNKSQQTTFLSVFWDYFKAESHLRKLIAERSFRQKTQLCGKSSINHKTNEDCLNCVRTVSGLCAELKNKGETEKKGVFRPPFWSENKERRQKKEKRQRMTKK